MLGRKGLIVSMLLFMLIIGIMVPVWPVSSAQTDEKAPVLDIIFVLDNSSSMKTNDPQRLTRQVVADFINGLSAETRVGILLFTDSPELIMPLSLAGNSQTSQTALEDLKKLDYNGQATNIPAAMERAIYELKNNGRQDAQPVVIIMTDGIIDTGDRANDMEKQRWLQEDLAAEAKDSGIRIFGIAFTDKADYSLMQILGQKTGGSYYRALRTDDIQEVFSQIQQNISTPVPAQISADSNPKTSSGLSTGSLWLETFGGVLVLAIAGCILIKRKPLKQQSPAVPHEKNQVLPKPQPATIPLALLEDESKATQQARYKINKLVTVIGRLDPTPGNSALDIGIPRSTVSALHATIEFRDNGFYLVDQDSTNGTFLNSVKIKGEARLKSGDEIAFDQYKFKFILPGQIERGQTVLKASYPIDPVQPLKPEQQPGVELNPNIEAKEPEQDPKAPLADNDADEPATYLKPDFCEFHPSFKATELCPVCKKGYCINCMHEKDGRMICRRCLEKEA